MNEDEIKAIEEVAKKELREEEFRRKVEERKKKLRERNNRPWIQKMFPFIYNSY
jgi:hypothetical protein